MRRFWLVVLCAVLVCGCVKEPSVFKTEEVKALTRIGNALWIIGAAVWALASAAWFDFGRIRK